MLAAPDEAVFSAPPAGATALRDAAALDDLQRHEALAERLPGPHHRLVRPPVRGEMAARDPGGARSSAALVTIIPAAAIIDLCGPNLSFRWT